MNRLLWFAILAILPAVAQNSAAQGKRQAPPPAAPKPSVEKPLVTPAKPSPVENQDIDRRRERMKQRDSEIDRVLKERQRKNADKSRDQQRR